MSILRNAAQLCAVVCVILLGSEKLLPQKGSGSQTPTGGTSSPASTGIINNPLFNGHVVMADGTALPQPVAIERVCSSGVAVLGYTDVRGYFTVQLMQTAPAMQDASQNGRDAFSAGLTTTSSNMNGLGVVPPDMAASSQTVLAAVSNCDLRAALAGYQSTSAMILPTPGEQTIDVGAIVLLKAQEQGATVSATSMNAPHKARKAYEAALALLRKQKEDAAQSELEKAVAIYPRYAVAWARLGWIYQRQNRLDDARAAFSQAQAADDKFVPAYIGLTSIAVRQSKWAEAEKVSHRATELDGVDFPLGFYYNAVANLELGEIDKAESSARMAERLDVRNSLPQIKLLLGQILARKRDYAAAAEELTLYLKLAPSGANLEGVRQQLAELQKLATQPQPPADAQTAASAPPSSVASQTAEVQLAKVTLEEAAKAAPVPMTSPETWAPPDVDEVVPPARSNVPCSVQEVVRAAGIRAKELMDNLQQFSATEAIEHVSIDKQGDSRHAESAVFKYVAQLRVVGPGELEIKEYRNGKASRSQSFPAQIATEGMAAHALLFHPSIVGDLTVTCEGLSSVHGKPAWQLHFVQLPNRRGHFREYHTQKGWFPVLLKGRAWIAADTYNVLRMETDLAQPVDAIALRKDHVIIDYRPVPFPKRKVQLWLPESTDLYVELNGQRLHRRHTFSDFELFWVDVNEKAADLEKSGG